MSNNNEKSVLERLIEAHKKNIKDLSNTENIEESKNPIGIVIDMDSIVYEYGKQNSHLNPNEINNSIKSQEEKIDLEL